MEEPCEKNVYSCSLTLQFTLLRHYTRNDNKKDTSIYVNNKTVIMELRMTFFLYSIVYHKSTIIDFNIFSMVSWWQITKNNRERIPAISSFLASRWTSRLPCWLVDSQRFLISSIFEKLIGRSRVVRFDFTISVSTSKKCRINRYNYNLIRKKFLSAED